MTPHLASSLLLLSVFLPSLVRSQNPPLRVVQKGWYVLRSPDATKPMTLDLCGKDGSVLFRHSDLIKASGRVDVRKPHDVDLYCAKTGAQPGKTDAAQLSYCFEGIDCRGTYSRRRGLYLASKGAGAPELVGYRYAWADEIKFMSDPVKPLEPIAAPPPAVTPVKGDAKDPVSMAPVTVDPAMKEFVDRLYGGRTEEERKFIAQVLSEIKRQDAKEPQHFDRFLKDLEKQGADGAKGILDWGKEARGNPSAVASRIRNSVPIKPSAKPAAPAATADVEDADTENPASHKDAKKSETVVDDCMSLKPTTPIETVIACVFHDKRMHALIKRYLKDDNLAKQFRADAIDSMPSEDDDPYDVGIKNRETWLGRARKSLCAPASLSWRPEAEAQRARLSEEECRQANKGADAEAADDCRSLKPTTPIETVIACVFHDKGMHALIKRYLKDDNLAKKFRADAIDSMPSEDDDPYDVGIKIRETWLGRARESLCAPAAVPDYPGPIQCGEADVRGNKELAKACQTHDKWLREAKAKEAVAGPGKPEDPIAAECRQAKEAAAINAAPGGAGNLKGSVPPVTGSPVGEPGFFQKYGKPIGAVVGALAGFAVMAMIGAGPFGLLAIAGLALAGWFAGGYLAGKGQPSVSASSAASAPSPRDSETQAP